MLRLVQRTPSDFYKTSVVLKTMSPSAFGNVSTNAIRTANNLPTNRVFGEGVPLRYDVPNGICQFFRKFIHPKIFKI